MKKRLKAISLILFLFVVYIYVCNVVLLPDSIVIFQGEQYNIKSIYGIEVKEKSSNVGKYNVMQTSSNMSEKVNKVGTINLSLDLFGTIPLREIDVNVIPRTTVVPLGNSVGLKLYTNGVLVVGTSEIKDSNNVCYKPYESSGIQEGDRIIEINNCSIKNTDELVNCVNRSQGEELEIVYVRNTDKLTTTITPVKDKDNEYKIGLWVRDAAAGVGTATFYEPSTGMFAALGHGITDIDTGDIVEIANGELTTSTIISIKKGEKGEPGEIRGTIDSGLKLGNVYKNGVFGICGELTNKGNMNINKYEEMDVALRSEIEEGKAYIICELENGKREQYEIEIQKVYSSNNYDNKSMLIKVTDSRLLEKTRGYNSGDEWFTYNSK